MTKKILVVDDEQNIALALKDIFTSKGYTVLSAFTGKEALVCLSQHHIDLVVLDIEMPDISGIEILKQVKRKHADIKTVILSGFLEEYKKEVDKIGCDAYLNKPFSLNALIQTLESILGEKGYAGKALSALFKDSRVQAKARLLFVEPNEIMYSSKRVYFQDARRCKGDYEISAAFSESQIMEKMENFKPDIVISDINMFRLYKLEDRFLSSQFKQKDIILYGISAAGTNDAKKKFHFIGGLFDPITAAVTPKEMDKLGQTVRNTAIVHGLYIMIG
ncbi:MAG: response regulator [Candidatus Omnitrophota bacterium]